MSSAVIDAPPGPAADRNRLHLVFSIDTMSVGGTEMNAIRTAERLDRGRYRLSVVTLRGEGPLAARYERMGVPVLRFPIRNLYGPETVRQGIRLARFLRAERVSVVHCHDQYSNFFSTMAARWAGVPVIIASKRWLHSPLRYRIANGVGFRAASRVIANSDAVAASLQRDDRLAPDRVVVVPNFVDEAAFGPPPDHVRQGWVRELGLEPDAVVVGIVASLLPIKDHATLLRAVASLTPEWPALRLVVVGQGPELDRLRALADELGIARAVRFAGLRPQIPSFHFLFDISVLSSVSEGFPNSLVEAMAAGRPIVATDVGGVRDAVRNGENGLLVAAGDAPAFAGALRVLLRDADLRRHMGAVGAQRAREEFHAAAVVGSLERLYERLLVDAGQSQ
ncbi:MAG TPA: glycosyltransferase [Gemmatimonadaceae bacterium]|nr:glycosyltransferase [Gemmatimonadaceae bacterium]